MTDWKGRHVLITGGLGFIGSNLAHRLVKHGTDVTLLDALLPHLGGKRANVADIAEQVRIVEGDLRDESLVADLVADSDVVYHCAAQNDRAHAGREPQMDVDINAKGTVNILDAAASADPAPRVVYTSSLAVYGRPESNPVDESTPARPMDLYGANKRASEHYCRIYYEQEGVPTTVCRLANGYGPRAPIEKGYGVQGTFVAKALRGETIEVFEPGDMIRDIVYIEDIVDALETLGTNDAVLGEEFVLGSGDPTELLDLAETVVDVAGTGAAELVPWPPEWTKIDRGDVYCDPSKLESTIDWQPRTDLETGLRETIEFYRANRETYL